MKLLWVNHASFVVEAGPIRLITDPWMEGTAFNDGWRLVADTRFRYEDFAGITHIWFSHEHPDHFCPANLRRIPEQYRKRITVLFHATRDRRVINLCSSLGFPVQELPLNRTVSLGGNVSIICGPQGLLDSWMALTDPEQTLLNMNDCVFDDPGNLVSIKERVGRVDLLLSQFSFATWIGNQGDFARHQMHAQEKLAEMRRQIEIFAPRWFIPFASYIFFSHAENCYMNQAANRIDDVYRYAQEELGHQTVVLFPGDAWEIGQTHDSIPAIRSYTAALEVALTRTPDRSRCVTLAELERAATALIQKNRGRNNRLLLNLLPSAVVSLTNLEVDVEFSYRRGLRQTNRKPAALSLSADSLLYCLEYDWGGNTLEINGRYQVLPRRDPEWFFRLLRVSQHNAAGERLEEMVVKKVWHCIRDVFRCLTRRRRRTPIPAAVGAERSASAT